MPLPGLTRAAADRRYPQRLRALMRPISALPAALASPPTIGTAVAVGSNLLTSTNGSALTSPVSVPYFVGGLFTSGPDAGKYRTTGWTLGDSAPGDSAARHYGQPAHPGAYTGGNRPATVEFIHSGTSFELRLYIQSGGPIRLYVDGVPNVLTGAIPPGVSAGAAMLIPVTFSGAATRRIKIEFTGANGFGGVVRNGADGLVATSRGGLGPQILLVGDSFSDGANGVGPIDTYAHQLGRLLNADMWIDGMGGTGMVSTGGGGAKAAYGDRLTACANESRLKPDIVVLQGSTNDAPSSATVGATCTTLIAQVRTQWPTAKVIVPGLMYCRGTLGTGMGPANTAVRTAATAGTGGADLFVDCQTEAWFTGNTSSASPSGAVNSDIFMSSDGVHPTATGHEFLAGILSRRIADYVLSA